MINPIKSGAGVSDGSLGGGSGRRKEGGYRAARAGSASSGPAPGADLRLVIERDAEGAYLVYKLIDRTTGAVVAELPRDEVASLAQAEAYTAGSVVRTKA
jgi:hypothetical protein